MTDALLTDVTRRHGVGHQRPHANLRIPRALGWVPRVLQGLRVVGKVGRSRAALTATVGQAMRLLRERRCYTRLPWSLTI